MNYFKQTLRELQIGVIIFGILNILIGMWFPKNMLAWVLGGVLGTVTALVMTDNMARAVVKAVSDETKASARMRFAFFFRYALAVVVMIVACVSPYTNPIATFIGIFSIKFATYLSPLIHKINLKINPNALESDGSEETEEENNDSEPVVSGR
ncbi:MAG: ATP synthase subunit I [Lachnospiraceae bacterium]|nr:ATP synthase subunit I [Lachnospiraceae bacterium]MBR4413088.1 ATP synthase subunit I [Lachnospiraceae bacterium]MBR5067329.1 ATP synthase subunit I [Lachnospiraceae bacterium]MBR5916587.1 ATP synthase subunit I [Lachnospiraceae bacterium]